MAHLNRWVSRTALILSAGAWSAVMCIVGILLVIDWPARFGWWSRPWELFGAVLIAAGQFIFALTAARLFPLASPKVVVAFELLPWAGLLIALAGGWLW